MELKDVVMKLVGNIEPIGETNTDNYRFENLKQLCSLIEELVFEVEKIARNKDRPEFSIKRAGEYALIYSKKYRNVIDNDLD
jgi:hypothetical protein